MKHAVTVVYSTDSQFWLHTCVSLYSLLTTNRDTPLDVWILTDQVTPHQDRDLAFLNQAHPNVRIVMYPVDESELSHAPIMLESFSIVTYYRLLMGNILPESVDRVLYLDGDTIIRGSLDDLFNIDLAGHALGAVAQLDFIDGRSNSTRIGLSDDDRYFNAGVLLVDLHKWRRQHVGARCLQYIQENLGTPSKLILQDQDALNSVLAGKWKSLTSSFNYSEWTVRPGEFIKGVVQDDGPRSIGPHILHFSGTIKPWHGGGLHPFERDYWHYRQETPFADNLQFLRFRVMASVRSVRRKLIVLARWIPGGATFLRYVRSVIPNRTNVLPHKRLK